MFVSCPHCRDLVATDPDTRLPPRLCTRCGGVLREAADSETAAPADTTLIAREPSLASFLRSEAPAQAQVPPPAIDATMIENVLISDVTIADTEVAEETDPQPPAEETDAEVAIAEATAERDESATAAAAIETDPATASHAPAASPATVSATHSPSFTRRTAQPPAHPAALWQWAALVLLSLLLLLQVLVADRTRLAADASWRPLIAGLCNLMGCSMPAWHQPGALTMLSRDVRPIAGTPGGLNVQATFRNDARWAQAWPVLLLSLSDADGRVIGARAFTPREYLGAAATQGELAPGQSARIALQLREPDPDVVAFTFDFR